VTQNRSQLVRVVILVGILFLVADSAVGAFHFLTTFGPSYTTGYEGVHARFAGWATTLDVKGTQWKKQSEPLWDTTFIHGGGPAFAGEMTSVFIPSESIAQQPAWIPSDWLVQATAIRNPVDTYEWEVQTQDSNLTAVYHMELWRLKWYFSISCEPNQEDLRKIEVTLPTESSRLYLTDTQIWFEYDIRPIWYFNGTDSAYFAIAEMRLSDLALGGKLKNGERVSEADSRCRVLPMSERSVLPIYYGLFGSDANRAEKETFDYKGKELNPRLFTDKVYSYFTLKDFGVTSWWDWGTAWRADVVTVGVDVDVFVIGEWKVKDVQSIPDEYGRTASYGTTPLGGFFSGILAWFGSPEGRLIALLAVGIIVFLILAIFAPWVLIALMSVFGSRRGRG